MIRFKAPIATMISKEMSHTGKAIGRLTKNTRRSAIGQVLGLRNRRPARSKFHAISIAPTGKLIIIYGAPQQAWIEANSAPSSTSLPAQRRKRSGLWRGIAASLMVSPAAEISFAKHGVRKTASELYRKQTPSC